MAQVTRRGVTVQINGQLPLPGSQAPDFSLVAKDLSDITLGSLVGRPTSWKTP